MARAGGMGRGVPEQGRQRRNPRAECRLSRADASSPRPLVTRHATGATRHLRPDVLLRISVDRRCESGDKATAASKIRPRAVRAFGAPILAAFFFSASAEGTDPSTPRPFFGPNPRSTGLLFRSSGPVRQADRRQSSRGGKTGGGGQGLAPPAAATAAGQIAVSVLFFMIRGDARRGF